MNLERGRKLQERVAKEAIALLTLSGTPADTAKHEQAVSLSGKVWDIPEEETKKWLDAIARERVCAETGSEEHVYPEGELPIIASGMETLDAVWDLFETSIHLNGEQERTALFDLANELAEAQNLLDWIEKTPAEKDAWKAAPAAT